MGWTCNTLRWKSSCRGVLLAAAVLSSGFRLAQAQEIPVVVEPAQPLEGQDATLTPGGKPDFILCYWYRGEQTEASRIFTYIPSSPVQQNGPGFTGRETGGPGCSLHIGSLMLNDTGDYAVSKIITGGLEMGRVHVRVSAEVRDVMVTGPSVATEDLPVTLTCTAVGSSVSYSWFKGNQSLEPGQHVVLTNTNQNLTFDPSHRSDSGDYTCRGSNSFSSGFSEPHRLDILYGPDPPVIHELIDREHFKVHFSCRADSYPAASYIWFLNGKFLPDQQNPLVRDLAPEHGGSYTCQAENGSTRQKRNTTLELEVQGQWRSAIAKKP